MRACVRACVYARVGVRGSACVRECVRMRGLVRACMRGSACACVTSSGNRFEEQADGGLLEVLGHLGQPLGHEPADNR